MACEAAEGAFWPLGLRNEIIEGRAFLGEGGVVLDEKSERGQAECGPQITRRKTLLSQRADGQRTPPLGQTLSPGILKEWMVGVHRHLKSQKRLEYTMHMRREQQVFTARHARHLLNGVIHDHGQVIAGPDLFAGQYNIAQARRIDLHGSGIRIGKEKRSKAKVPQHALRSLGV